ncbi:DUF488 domain-containing protein [Cytobacillus sp. Hz8]|uniref:DUF488 domain-containing protein n=1 Tax=Cytobacillus sp. Hz8 TaxID=3347168 RepID=UPI0035D578F7
MQNIFLKRIYEPYEQSDGLRILIDRLWPRGISKEAANLDEWVKEAAPSSELRKWFCHKPELFEEFKAHYQNELRTNPLQKKAVEQIIGEAREGRVTLLYGAKDPIYNHAVVLLDCIKKSIR